MFATKHSLLIPSFLALPKHLVVRLRRRAAAAKRTKILAARRRQRAARIQRKRAFKRLLRHSAAAEIIFDCVCKPAPASTNAACNAAALTPSTTTANTDDSIDVAAMQRVSLSSNAAAPSSTSTSSSSAPSISFHVGDTVRVIEVSEKGDRGWWKVVPVLAPREVKTSQKRRVSLSAGAAASFGDNDDDVDGAGAVNNPTEERKLNVDDCTAYWVQRSHLTVTPPTETSTSTGDGNGGDGGVGGVFVSTSAYELCLAALMQQKQVRAVETMVALKANGSAGDVKLVADDDDGFVDFFSDDEAPIDEEILSDDADDDNNNNNDTDGGGFFSKVKSKMTTAKDKAAGAAHRLKERINHAHAHGKGDDNAAVSNKGADAAAEESIVGGGDGDTAQMSATDVDGDADADVITDAGAAVEENNDGSNAPFSPLQATISFDFAAEKAAQLSVKAGDKVVVSALSADVKKGWWRVHVAGNEAETGAVPLTFIVVDDCADNNEALVARAKAEQAAFAAATAK
jgi:hypothetical protein